MDIIYEVTSLAEIDSAVESFMGYDPAMESNTMTAIKNIVIKAVNAIARIISNIIFRIRNFIRRLKGKPLRISRDQALAIGSMCFKVDRMYYDTDQSIHTDNSGDLMVNTAKLFARHPEKLDERLKILDQYSAEIDDMIEKFKEIEHPIFGKRDHGSNPELNRVFYTEDLKTTQKLMDKLSEDLKIWTRFLNDAKSGKMDNWRDIRRWYSDDEDELPNPADVQRVLTFLTKRYAIMEASIAKITALASQFE